MTKYDDFIKVLQYNGKLFYFDDIIKWNKYNLYGFANFTFESMCLGDRAPILDLLVILLNKRLVINILKKEREDIEKTKI